jgi:hypothetical protein
MLIEPLPFVTAKPFAMDRTKSECFLTHPICLKQNKCAGCYLATVQLRLRALDPAQFPDELVE